MQMPHTYAQILQNLGFADYNPLQCALQQQYNDAANLLLLAPTGSGKTLAYLAPLYRSLDPHVKEVQALIIVPSRELALQIEQVWKAMGTGLKINSCYGGHALEVELRNLSNPPAVLVGTPGRLADHIERGSVATANCKTLILDEFDKSLQMGFQDDMAYLIRQMPKLEKRVLVSATNEREIPAFALTAEPLIIDFSPTQDGPAYAICQVKLQSTPEQTLAQLLATLGDTQAIVFCNLRETTDELAQYLNAQGFYAVGYHGGMEQIQRERALVQFRNGSARYLITTDLAARGLDIPDMQHVIHYELPLKHDEFVHRNGRTARMQASGTVYILAPQKGTYTTYSTQDYPEFPISSTTHLPAPPAYKTLYVSAGKKQKINKIDIVGFFTQKGNIPKSAIGLIEVKDYVSFVAVQAQMVQPLLRHIAGHKIKAQRLVIEVARDAVYQ